MVTGASTADLALILVDARKGVVEQSRRHSVIASLLSVRHLVLCVNKMDLVDYDQRRLRPDLGRVPRVGRQARHHRPHLHPDLGAARRQRHPALAQHAVVRRPDAAAPPRAPLHRLGPQPHRRPLPGAVGRAADDDKWHDYRGYAGQVAGGIFRPGDEVLVLPSGLTTTIAGIDLYGEELDEAIPPQSVTIRLADNLDVSRGDMICRPNNAPTRHPGDRRDDLLVQRAAAAGAAASTSIKHTTRSAKCARARPALPPRREHAPPRRDDRHARDERHGSGVACASPSRCSSTSTAATAPPGSSSSSTRARTRPSAPA